MALLTESGILAALEAAYRKSFQQGFFSPLLSRRVAKAIAKVLSENFFQSANTPSFRIYRENDLGVGSLNEQAVNYETVDWDTDSLVTMGPPTYVTLNKTGIWLLGASTALRTQNAGDEIKTEIQLDPLGGGAYASIGTIGEWEIGDTATEIHTQVASILANVTATDLIRTYAYSPDSSTWTIKGGQYQTALWGYYLGRTV